MNLVNHPAFKEIPSYKKPFHLARIFLVKNLTRIYPRENFIGITGSVGKTTTKEMCLLVLSQKYLTIASRANLDPIFNIPLTISRLRPKIKKVILEMGVEYPGEMDFYLSMVHPATAIITRISYAHSEFLGKPEEIIREKGKLVRQLPKNGFAILNGNDVYCRTIAEETSAKILFFGVDPKNCDVWASNIRIENNQTKFEINYGVERIEITLKLLGRHFIYPALAAAALGICNNLSLVSIKRGLEKMEPVEHRLQLLPGPKGSYILDDTYNSSPSAVEEALNLLSELPARRRLVVLGEMRELGPYSESLHRNIAGKIYKDRFDVVFLGSGEAKYIADELLKLGFSAENLKFNLSNSEITDEVSNYLEKGDIVLIKGSRAVKLDEVVKSLNQPGC